MTDSAPYLTQLHRLLNRYLSLADIQAICFDLNVDYEIAGTIPPDGGDVQLTDDGTIIGESRWAPIIYQDVSGWVNTRYLTLQSLP